MGSNQPMANGIQRVAASLYNNPDDDFKHVAGTTPATGGLFTQNTSFVERVKAYGSTARDSSASDAGTDAPQEDYDLVDTPAVTSFTVPDEQSCARHATTESVGTQGAHPQHVQPSPAHEPLPPPPVNTAPVEPGELPEFVPVVTGFPVNEQHPAPTAPMMPSAPNPADTPTHTRANTVVEDQLNHISHGPFPEELKQALIKEVLAFATQDIHAITRTTCDTDATRRQVEEQQAEDAKFVDQMEQALKISEDTLQPNDPNIQPLVGCVHNFTALVELQKGNKGMYEKLRILAPFIHQYRPVIGDGNCFYRCFAFGLVESNLWHRDQLQALKVNVKQMATAAITWLSSKQAMQLLGQDYTAFTRRARALMEVGYKKFSFMIQQCLTLMDASHDPWPTLLCIFQENDGEDIMHLIRQLAAYEMLSKHMQYETFLPAIEGLRRPPMLREGEAITVPLVVSRLVVVNGMEAEHVMIQSLASLLQVSIGVVYCDGEAMPQVHVIQPVHRQDGNRHPEPRIFVIYRSGHYDLVYPDSTSWIELQASTNPDRG